MAQDHSGTAGQEPVGYDYQQPWYPPQQEAAAETWGGYQQQGWGEQWQQSGLPQQREPEAYGDGYYAPEVTDPGYGQYQEPLYAPPGVDGYYNMYGAEQPMADQSVAQPLDAQQAVPQHYVAGEPTAEGLFPATGEPLADEPFDEEPARLSLVERAKAAAGSVISAEHAPSKRALAIRAGAGAAALAVLITAGVLATEDSGGSSSSGDSAAAPGFNVAHAKAWAAQPASAAPAGADDTLVGSWLLSDSVVRADSTGVHAYALADGKPTWTVAPPAPGAAACGLSPTVNATGLGAVLFRPQADPKSPCTLLAAVDTKTGKTAWSKTLSDKKDDYSAHVAVTADKVIAVGDDKASAWAAADGKDAWQYGGQGKFCSLSGGATGNTVLLHSTCADSNPGDQAVALNATDGKVRWWRGLNNQPKTVTVLSAEPAVVLTTGDKPTDDKVFSWGTSGDPAVEIPVSTDGGRLDVGRGAFDVTPGAFFQDHTMITTVVPPEGGPSAVTAYDVATGKPLWKTPTSEKGKARAVGFENGALVLAVDERLDQPAHLSRFAVAGGQEATGGAFPQGTGSLLTSGRVLTGGGMVIAVPEHSTNFGIATAFQAKG